jgi:hypothetical protein
VTSKCLEEVWPAVAKDTCPSDCGSIAHGNTHDCSSEKHNSSNFLQIAKQLGGNTGFQLFPTRLYSEDLITSFLIRARLRVPGYAGSLA